MSLVIAKAAGVVDVLLVTDDDGAVNNESNVRNVDLLPKPIMLSNIEVMLLELHWLQL